MRTAIVVLLAALAAGSSQAEAAGSGAWSAAVQGNAGEKLAATTAASVADEIHPSFTIGEQAGAKTSGASIGAGESRTSDSLSFASTNEYIPISGSPWSHLAEPFRDTTLTATSTDGDQENDVFIWTFADNTVLEGRVVNHTFKTIGRQQLSLAHTVVSTGETFHLQGYVMVKYVRREIRQLTDTDREAFFDAMETLYRLPTSEGNAKYGDEYKGISFFVQMHLDGAGVTDCDHWHDDAGIMTHHTGYTLLFEQALQIVDPTVSIPYWEYTIEAAEGLQSYGDSVVFTDDWFGNASPDNALHTVDTGRWAYLNVMTEAWDFVHNPYGLLRSPWNVDATPYVTRHNTTNNVDAAQMVGCSSYQSCFESTSLSDMNNCLNGGTHGPVHIKLGGEWDNPEEDFITDVGYSDAVPLITKYLWRKGYLKVPTSCSIEENGAGDASTCRTSCPAELYESRGMTDYDVLMDVYAIHWLADSAKALIVYKEEEDRFVIAGHEDDEVFQKAFWSKMLASLCDPGHVGELFTSSAPYDPLFWVIHPTAERFLSWRRKLARTEGIDTWSFDEEWGYKHGSVTGETGTVCDWSGVRDGTLDLPTCSRGICGGHKEDDILPFEIKLNGEIVKMSNAEWLDFIYPDNEDLPYMYNEFTWDHCTAEGFSMGVI